MTKLAAALQPRGGVVDRGEEGNRLGGGLRDAVVLAAEHLSGTYIQQLKQQ